MLLANSLFHGFATSNAIGQSIVICQVLGSIGMVAVIVSKWKAFSSLSLRTRCFLRDVLTFGGILDYYAQRRPPVALTGIEGIYAETSERLLKLLTPDMRALVAGRESGQASAALSTREIELVRSTCEHRLDEEAIKVSRGMGALTAIVALEPMLGLLGTVWGVLDAFAEMGTAGSASLATIAPSISAALVTTVIGLLVAIPGVCADSVLSGQRRKIVSDMEGFVDELMGRIACEYQGRGV